MIKASDVRIGNFIQSCNTGEYVEVDWLVIKHLNDGNYQLVATFDTPFYKPVYEPIILDDEVLRKFAFTYYDEDDYIGWLSKEVTTSNGTISIKINKLKDKDGYYYVTHHTNRTILHTIELNYLHELQNLFWAITQTELRDSI